ncbi:SpaA isopeptide-forming pilin-related protein [Arcanobacterium hippocoleae]
MPALDVFDSNGRRIRYEVSEQPITGMGLYNQLADEQNLRYIFYNEKRTPVDETPQAENQQCTGGQTFGVTSLNLSDKGGVGQMNQFLYTSNSYGWGSKLTGTFQIPANAGDGDYFTLRIPPELKLNAAVNSNNALGSLNASVNGSQKEIGKFYLTDSDLITFKLNSNAQHDKTYSGEFSIGYNMGENKLKRVNGVGYKRGEPYSWGFEPGFGAAYDERNPKSTNFEKKLQFHTGYVGLNNSAVPCTYTLNKNVRFHFEDEEIYSMLKNANKYVIAETPDSLTYRLVFNAAGGNWLRNKWFYDRLTDTVDLYHGNTQGALQQDLKIYQGSPLRSGGVVTESLKELWPQKSPQAEPGLNITEVVLNKVDFTRNGYVQGDKPLHFHHEFYAGVSGHKNQTIVFDVKTRKKEPAVDGFYYNEANFYVSGGSFQYVINHNRYRATIGKGTARFGSAYDVSFMKVDENGTPIKSDPASFYLKSKQNGLYSSKAAADKNGVVTFKDVIPQGKQINGSAHSNGEYELVEIKAPNGYQTAAKMDVKITLNGSTPQIEYKGQKYPAVFSGTDFSKLLKVENQPFPALRIQKIDAVSHAPLPGAVLKLSEYDSTKYKFGASGNTNEQKGTLLRTLMLGCENPKTADVKQCKNLQVSEFRVPQTRADRLYVFEEAAAPAGYSKLGEKIYIKAVKDTQAIKFEQVNAQGQKQQELKFDAATASFTYQLANKRTSRIQFFKQDAAGNPIVDPKARFKLYVKNSNGPENIALSSGETVKAKPFGNGSEVKIDKVNNFYYTYDNKNLDGTYYLLETVAPTGMIKPKFPVAVFHVKNNVVYSDTADNKVVMKNYPLGRFKVTKTDDSAQPKKLGQVGFTLYRDAKFNESVGGEKKTNSDGVLYFTGLESGTYYLKETHAPSGHKPGPVLKVVVSPEGKPLLNSQPAVRKQLP